MSSEVETNTDQKSQEEAYHDFCCELDDPNHQIGPSDFVHLHNHTHYSLLDGLTKVKNGVKVNGKLLTKEQLKATK